MFWVGFGERKLGAEHSWEGNALWLEFVADNRTDLLLLQCIGYGYVN